MKIRKFARILIFVIALLSILYWIYNDHSTEMITHYNDHSTETITHQTEKKIKEVNVASKNGETSLARSREAVNKPSIDVETNTEELLSASIDAIRNNDQKAGTLLTLLTNALRSKNEEYAYFLIQELLLDGSLAKDEKKALATVLGEARTYEALSILMTAEEQITDEELHSHILKNIMHAGDLAYGYLPLELSPLLEEKWLNNNNNQENLLMAVGIPMIKIGAPSGIKAIMEVLNNPDKYSPLQVEVAESLMPNILNKDAAASLVQYFNGYDLDNKALVASGYGLAYLGYPESTHAIVGWAANAPIEAKDIINKWINIARGNTVEKEEWHEKFIKMVTEKKFRNESIKQDIIKIWEKKLWKEIYRVTVPPAPSGVPGR